MTNLSSLYRHLNLATFMQTCGLCSWQTLGRRPRFFLCMLESFRIVFTAYSLFLAVPTARFSLSRSWWGVGGLGGHNNVLSLVSWFKHSWSYVPPFFPCKFHHVLMLYMLGPFFASSNTLFRLCYELSLLCGCHQFAQLPRSSAKCYAPQISCKFFQSGWAWLQWNRSHQWAKDHSKRTYARYQIASIYQKHVWYFFFKNIRTNLEKIEVLCDMTRTPWHSTKKIIPYKPWIKHMMSLPTGPHGITKKKNASCS